MSDIITITQPAQEFIDNIFKNNPGYSLVVGYDNKGCSGHKYTFYLCEEKYIPEYADFVSTIGGRVVIQPDSTVGLSGATLKLHTEDFGEQLVWDNPQAINSCGCGASFKLPGEGGCN